MWRILQDLMWAMVRSFGPADPVDALVGLFRRLAQFVVGGLLMGRDHSPSDIALVGDPSGGVDSVEQSGGVQCGHVVHGARVGVGGPHQAPAGQDQDLDVHARAPVLDRPQIAAPAPVRAGEEGAVHHVVAVPGHLLRGEHRTTGVSARILVLPSGRLVWASDPYPGSMHDVAAPGAFRAAGGNGSLRVDRRQGVRGKGDDHPAQEAPQRRTE